MRSAQQEVAENACSGRGPVYMSRTLPRKATARCPDDPVVPAAAGDGSEVHLIPQMPCIARKRARS